MGASSVVDPSKVIDPSIGSLVWVRRRNGWWWPGQIISEDDLPEGCIQMPRSGTPVKLLGKEEAIVDWYNLEKSKRVKPFRCGEYTECIEKAMAAASNVSKKRVKYARREDAILEALDLERASLSKTQSPVVLSQEKEEKEEQCTVEGSQSPLQSDKAMENVIVKSEVDSTSGQELSQSGVSFEEPSNQIQTASKNPSKCNESEDDGNEGAKKRMKGLEDLGMRVAAAAASSSSSPSKRKISQISHAHELLKRKSKRRALTKVLESTTMVPSRVDPDDLLGSNVSTSDEKPIVCRESNGSKTNSSLLTNGVSCDETAAVLPGNSDQEPSQSLFDVPLVAEEKCAHDSYKTNHSTEKSTSEWQLKGKRNSRSRKSDEAETNNVNPSKKNEPSTGPIENSGPTSRPVTEIPGEPISQRLLPCRSTRFTPHPKYDSSDFSVSHRRTTIGSGLYEVDLRLEPTSPTHNAPLISLTSKIFEQPIRGYPIDVEVLEDGHCDDLITVSESYSNTSQLNYKMPFRRSKAPHKRRKKAKKKYNKSKKKKSGEKIRKLSSLSSSKLPLVEKVNTPLLACVPLKVVFSRINADLNSSVMIR